MYVISCGLITRDHKPRDGRCWNSEGKPESRREKWARFLTPDEAVAFADAHGITTGPGQSEILQDHLI